MDGIVVGQGRYILGRQIGSGSFGRIYSGENMRYCSSTLSGTCIETDTQYAVKMEKKATKVPQLKHEAKIIEKMQDEGCPETTCAVKCAGGFPQLLWVGDDEEGEHTVVVMQLLGASIEDLFEFCAKKLTLKTVLMLVDQMVQKTVALLSQTLQLERLETLHSRGIFHRDIKPDNFLVGHGEDGGTLYIIDFGLAKQWRHPKTRAHVAERSGSKRDLVGTARYASCNAHLGLDLSRRDDLESLGYVFVYLATGGLPWQGIRGGETAKDKYEKIGQKKMTTSLEELCRGLPPAFQAYLTYCKALAFDQDPDYDYMRSLFRQLFEQERFHYDFIFDWTVLSSRGQLRVTVEEARDLLGKDRGKSSDPYVTLQLGKSQRDKTAVINRNLNPEWHESFTFEITDPTAILSLHIWNKNSMKKDQFLGRVELPVATLEHGVTTDSWHVLQKRSAKSHVAGEVRLTLAYHAKAPLEETAGAEPPEKPSSEEQPASATPDGAAERQSDDGQGGPAEAGSKEDGEQVAEGPANAEAASAASSFDSCALAEVFSNVTDDLDVFTPVGDGDGREEGEEGESRSDGKTPTPAEGAAATQETSAEEVPAAKE